MIKETIVEEGGERYSVEDDVNGTIFWYKEGTNIIHREGGPAIEYANGNKVWCKGGKVHRENGPAVEYTDGTKEYWINNKRLENIKTNEELMIKLLLE